MLYRAPLASRVGFGEPTHVPAPACSSRSPSRNTLLDPSFISLNRTDENRNSGPVLLELPVALCPVLPT